MKYNTVRKKLIIPEYGRHIQEMVDHCLSLTDEKERNDFAEVIIDVMGVLNPHLRDVPDFKHKLWDQLFIMSNFQLDVNSPYPRPTVESVNSRPNKVPYPQHAYKFRYYGNNIRKMIEVAATWEDGHKKDGLLMVIANHMKKSYLLWNKDTVDDQTIFDHLYELSDGKINLKNTEESLLTTEKIQQNNQINHYKRNNNNNNNNNNKNNRKNQNNNYKNKNKQR